MTKNKDKVDFIRFGPVNMNDFNILGKEILEPNIKLKKKEYPKEMNAMEFQEYLGFLYSKADK